MLKVAGILSLIASLAVAVSGYFFISRYSISDSSSSMIEASLLQVAHLRFVIAALLAVVSAICLSALHISNTR